MLSSPAAIIVIVIGIISAIALILNKARRKHVKRIVYPGTGNVKDRAVAIYKDLYGHE